MRGWCSDPACTQGQAGQALTVRVAMCCQHFHSSLPHVATELCMTSVTAALLLGSVSHLNSTARFRKRHWVQPKGPRLSRLTNTSRAECLTNSLRRCYSPSAKLALRWLLLAPGRQCEEKWAGRHEGCVCVRVRACACVYISVYVCKQDQ